MQGYRQAPNSVIASISKPMPNTTPKANPRPHATGSSPASRRKKEIMRLMYGPPESMRVRCGLWLARVALRITGNHELANVARVLPLIPQPRLNSSTSTAVERGHGSGFVLCSLDTHDGMCGNLCAGAGASSRRSTIASRPSTSSRLGSRTLCVRRAGRPRMPPCWAPTQRALSSRGTVLVPI